jgi:hypothetical protein
MRPPPLDRADRRRDRTRPLRRILPTHRDSRGGTRVNIQLLDNRPLDAVVISYRRAWRHFYFDQLGERSIATDSPRDSNPFDHPPHVAFGVVTRAANDGSECICVLVEWEIGKFELMSQKSSTHS